MPYYAHTDPRHPNQPPDAPGVEWQLLDKHLKSVAELAQEFAVNAKPGNLEFAKTAQWAGLLHDLGKYRAEFQEYLRQNRERSNETDHAVYGAAAAAFQLESCAASFAIAGHHAGLHDSSDLSQMIEGSRYHAQDRLPNVLEKASPEIGEITKLKEYHLDDTDESLRSYEYRTRMLFSILLDADRFNTEQWDKSLILGKNWKRANITFHADRLLNLLHTAKNEKQRQRPHDELNSIRNEVFDACQQKGKTCAQGFYSLTVPTGGGKTLSSMSFALSHAQRHNLRRVIVVIPFLSIIEQNAKEYRSIFGADQVLEHHSAVATLNGKSQLDRNNTQEPCEASDVEKAMENWDAPIILTTSVQFIETLFAAKTSKARKLHNVARSVVIFDEVQTLPAHILEPVLDVFRELKMHWGVSFLFCSATQPAFRKSPNLQSGFTKDELVEIITDPPKLYRVLRRVNYDIRPKKEQWNWKQLADKMSEHPQSMCVLNLRRHAFEVWQEICDHLHDNGYDDEEIAGVIHLSSAMCPAHRLDLLGLSDNPPPDNVKARLTEGKPCRVVSTQLIEAGVDIDFPVLFRAMGPLDSIVQAAGRCNREGHLIGSDGNRAYGQVTIFHPEDGCMPRGIYSRGAMIAHTPERLNPEMLATDPEIFGDYFNELYQLGPTDHAKRGENTIQQDRTLFNFRKVAEHARVIKDDTVAVVVPYGRGEEMIDQIRKDQRLDRNTIRALQRYMVNVRNGDWKSDYRRLHDLGALEPLLPDRLPIPVLAKWAYKPELGVVIENRPLEDFVQ